MQKTLCCKYSAMYRFVPQETTQIEVASDTVMKSCKVIRYILCRYTCLVSHKQAKVMQLTRSWSGSLAVARHNIH